MRREKFRKFLPSLISLDLADINPVHIETGFIAKNAELVVKIEHSTDLAPGGETKATMTISYPNKGWLMIYDAEMPEDEARQLLSICGNKIKKYRYNIKHNDINVHINRYTLGVITIDIQNSSKLTSLPEYCGKEITNDNQYNELNLSGMREILRRERENKE